MKTYIFPIEICGSADTPEEAWVEAEGNFIEDPGSVPDEYIIEDEDGNIVDKNGNVVKEDRSYSFNRIASHIGHRIICVGYGGPEGIHNAAIECTDCNVVIVDENNPIMEGEDV